ncbi:RNA polymerase sigma-70 factor [Flexithrix dorotheae]|uniref:RNA polymerase sigma-70 factor n=1 Tax=Flexithrix dorotheae TaxID=70993 RepID=UPI000366B75C|nr:RNA polymerase sigma-70 factor [Flexithrix dorotheae]
MPDNNQNLLNTYLSELLHTDKEKFMELLFKSYYSQLCNFVFQMVKERDTAEDIVQEVFLKVWKNKENLDPEKSIKGYLYRSASNATLNFLEKHQRNVPMEESHLQSSELTKNETEETLGVKEIEEKISQAIDTLPPQAKTSFIMSRYEEMSYAEIAEALGISVKTVEKHMGRALSQLRKSLNAYLKHLISILIFLDLF